MFLRVKTVVAALMSAVMVPFAALLLGVSSQAFGSELAPQYLTDVWTADNGLPNSSVTAVAQTPDGYLWVGTYNGLARFDGVRFVTFDSANTPALAHARVRKLSVDSQGTLWINTLDGSLTSFRNGSFARQWTWGEDIDPDVTLVSSASNQVTFLLHRGTLRRKSPLAPAGTGWEELIPTNRMVAPLCVGDGAGTIWYRGSDKLLLRQEGAGFETLPDNSGLVDPRINCCTTDARGRLWVGTASDIAVWNGKQFQTLTPTNSESPLNVTFLSVAEDGHLWAVVNGRVLKGIDRRWVLEAESLRDVFTGNVSLLGARDDHHGGLWLYDYGRGLFHVDAGGQVRRFGVEDGFPGDRINCFFEDREGNWWAGLDAGGLVRMRERRFQTVGLGKETSTKPARSVCEDHDGTVWIGTLGDGLLCWPSGATVTNLMVAGGLDKGFAFSVYPGAAGRLWMSAGTEDLFVRDRDGIKRLLPGVHGVKALLVDHAERLWVGAKSGLHFADGKTPPGFALNEEIGRGDVRALAEDGSGNVWAGAEDGTIFRVAEGATTAFHTTDIKESHAIWSLLAEDNGTVWAGTFRGGLLRLQDGRFTRYGKKDGLPDDVICQILDDGQGNLWLGSHRGIIRIAKAVLEDFARGRIQSLTCTTFDRADGLPSLECSGGYQPAAWRARDGRLWFTTLKGAVSIQPRELQLNLLPPGVVIEELLIDGKSADNINGTQLLEVPPGRHQFEFRYTGNSLIASDRVQFRYRLEGADAEWKEAGTRRTVPYNYLPPGEYVFHVKAGNNDGIWSESGSTLKLKVLPQFYETWWFRLLAGIGIAALLAGTIRYTTLRRLRRKMEQLERQHAVERERTRIARDIHDDLGASLNLIAVLGDLAKKEKTDERIEKMSVTARQAVKSLDEIVWAVNPRNDTLAHLIDYAGQFAINYLRSAGIRCLLDVPEQMPGYEVPADVRHNLFLVIKEALQNIVKHSRATAVWLRVNVTTQQMRVVIEDNGCGFEQGSENPWADGLRNMRERLIEIGGECRIQSRVGAGTTITVELPWPPG